MNHGVKKEYID